MADRPVVRVRLGERWWSLRLKGGPRFKAQTEAYRQIVSGAAVRGELALYRIRAHDGKLAARPNGDQRVKYTVMVKMVAWFPLSEKGPAHTATDSLKVVTAKDTLLVALNARDERVWRYHGDHLRRWVAEHRRMVGRLADDQKAEQRPAPAFADRRSAAAVKYRNRMSSAVREIAAQLVGYAARRGFGTLEYDDSVNDFSPEFPYAALRGQISSKCEAAGLKFEHSNGVPQLEEMDFVAALKQLPAEPRPSGSGLAQVQRSGFPGHR
jgi:hypothetical protein